MQNYAGANNGGPPVPGMAVNPVQQAHLQPPTGPVLQPRDESLDALFEFVLDLVEKTEGRFSTGEYTIDGSRPIRCVFVSPVLLSSR